MDLIKPYLRQVDYFLFLGSIAILPLSIKLSSKLLFLAILTGLMRSIYTKNFSWFSNQKTVVVLNTLFVAFIILQGLVLYEPKIFIKTFERGYAPYLIFLLIPLFYDKNKIVKQIPKALLIGVCTLFILILVNSLIELQWYNREKVLEVFDMHHLYISLYILFIINILLSKVSKLNLISTMILLFIMAVFLLFFKSKAAIVVSLIIWLYHIIARLNLTIIKILGIGVIAVFLMVVFNTFLYDLYLNALDFRSRIWGVALDSIVAQPIFGYGSVSEHDILNKGHFLEGNYDFLDSNLNSHNQFITFFLKFGILGFVLALLPYIYLSFKVPSNLKKEFIGFLIVLGSMGFIESLYNRHHGIVFCCIMLYYYNSLTLININQDT